MPAFAHGRQPAPALAWFSSEAGQGVLAVEVAAMARVIETAPPLPWAWFGLPAAAAPESGRRGLLLRRQGTSFDGTLRCQLPLPLASESLGAVLLQHVLDDGIQAQPLLDECERVLAPGGLLWLAALNPWSPYRARWARSGLSAHDPGRWQAALRTAGFASEAVSLQWLGPHWRVAHGEAGVGAADRLRAGVALAVCKRVRSLIPPTPLKQLRWQAGRVPLATSSEQMRRPAAIMRR